MNSVGADKRKIAWWSKLFPVTILLAAAFLRFYALDLVSITNDEGLHGQSAMWYIATLDVQNLPLAGYPSVGVRNSALFLYLLSIPYLVVFHPLAGVAFVAGLNVLAIYLAWRLSRDRFGLAAANITLVLLAFSPWSVLYARQMWPPSCLAVATLYFLRVSLQWFDEGGRRRLCWMIVMAFVIPQFHFSGFCAPVWLAAVLLLRRSQISPKPLIAGGLIGLASWSPWIILEQTTGWLDVRNALHAAKGKTGAIETLTRSVEHFQSLLHSGNFEFWFAETPAELPEYFPLWLRLILPVAGVLVVITFVCSVIWACWRPADWPMRLLVLWSLLPVLMLLLVRPKVHPHYVLVGFPVPFMLVGALCAGVIVRYGNRLRMVMTTLLVMISIVHIAFLSGWYRYANDDRPNGAGQYQLSYRQRRAVVLTILEDAGQRRIPLSGPFSGQHPAFDLLYSFETYRRNYDDFPADESRMYWVNESRVARHFNDPNWVRAEQESIGRLLAKYRGLPRHWEIESHWNEGPTHIYRLRRVR